MLHARFRDAAAHDLFDMLPVIRERHCESPEQDLRACLSHRHQVSVVLDLYGLVLGFAFGTLNHDLEIATINQIGVMPMCRRQGVGRSLLQQFQDKLRDAHYTAIETTVEERNVLAQLFFRNCGFAMVKTQPQFYPDGQAGYVFRRPRPECEGAL
jgi:ribosomal protein S18 acetylase RimI-like enzyme